MKLVIAAALTAFAVSTISEPVLAICRSSASLANAHLKCISCGIQDYYDEKGVDDEIVPSEKWLLLLGMMAKQTSHLAPSRSDGRFVPKDNDIVVNDEAQKAYHRKVIAQIQAYGFCTKFRSKKSKLNSDLASDDWLKVMPFITRNIEASEDDLQKLAEFFGFANPNIGSNAESNMRYLITGKRVNPARETKATYRPDFGEEAKTDRRSKFKARLDEILPPERGAVASESKSSGLRECLEEIHSMQNGYGDKVVGQIFNGASGMSYDLCKSMADSCDLETSGFCAGAPVASAPLPPSATSYPVTNRTVTGKDLPLQPPLPRRGQDPNSLPGSIGGSSTQALDALPNPKAKGTQ